MTGLWLAQAGQSAAERLAQAHGGLDTPFLERLMGFVGIATMYCRARKMMKAGAANGRIITQ